MYSGHPLGLFPSSQSAPRVVVTNGMVIPNYSKREDYEKMNSLGCVTIWTNDSWFIHVYRSTGNSSRDNYNPFNAARMHLNLPAEKNLAGVTFVTSGLGGMSGAQAKAAVISWSSLYCC